jgi:hypothetical protein
MESTMDWHVTYRLGGGELRKASVRDFGLVPFDELAPVRKLGNHRQQARRSGLLHFASADKLVPCRSRLAMRALRVLDFDTAVTDALGEPFVLHRGAAVRGLRPPDFLVQLTDGQRLAVDVATQRATTTKAYTERVGAMKDAFADSGPAYQVVGEPERTVYANVAWLAGYRREPHQVEAYRDDVSAACSHPTRIDAVVDACGPPALIRPVLFHMLWTHELDADLSTPLQDHTVVRATGRRG